jgi:adenylate cyclase
MSKFLNASIAALMVGIVGLLISVVPFGLSLEENFGLHLLFKLRGKRAAPADVVIISMDRMSARRLNLPSSPSKWPRSMHARLINTLIGKKAAVIAFDIIFSEDLSSLHDEIFAEAIEEAGNVVLGEWIEVKKVPLLDQSGNPTGNLNIESIIQPISLLTDSAFATAPFALPKVPVRVNSYWAFKTSAGNVPTLPVVVFQVYALQVYNELVASIEDLSPSLFMRLPVNSKAVISNKRLKKVIQELREHFEQDPELAQKILKQLKISNPFLSDTKKNMILESLISMYRGPRIRYLNLYGPPGTIETISYYEIIESIEDSAVTSDRIDLNGKAVFVGLSERMRPEQKDGFYTVFSQPNGLDISGVEIAASAFANILEDMHITPLGTREHLGMVILWGVLIGLVCMLSPAIVSLGSVGGMSLFYAFLCHYQFKYSGVWLPLIVPLCIQVPVAFFGSVLWKYFLSNKERKNIRKAFGYYLPDDVINQLAKSISNIEDSHQVVYGTCLMTDVEQYTAVSESMDLEELSALMNQYFEAIFTPVKQNSGIVLDAKGDSMQAIWATPHPDAHTRNLACHAALDIAHAVDQFNQSSGSRQLPTRIGLHSGYISLGNIGAVDHFEYRSTGDIVNTASRLEGLNKYLDSRIVVSEEVIHQLKDFLVRPLGSFILAGKSKPIRVCELLGRIEQSDKKQKKLCLIFSRALEAYQKRAWQEAIDLLTDAMNLYNQDGPSRFYLKLCTELRTTPPATGWDGTIQLNKK